MVPTYFFKLNVNIQAPSSLSLPYPLATYGLPHHHHLHSCLGSFFQTAFLWILSLFWVCAYSTSPLGMATSLFYQQFVILNGSLYINFEKWGLFLLLWGFQQRNSQKALNWLILLKRWPCTKRGTWALCRGKRWGHPPVHLAQLVSTFSLKVDATERLPSLASLSLRCPISGHLHSTCCSVAQ